MSEARCVFHPDRPAVAWYRNGAPVICDGCVDEIARWLPSVRPMDPTSRGLRARKRQDPQFAAEEETIRRLVTPLWEATTLSQLEALAKELEGQALSARVRESVSIVVELQTKALRPKS